MSLGQRTKAGGNETARRILDHARRAFNERGVAAVGIREIARDLGLSPGNVSYHFPTKEALVVALIEQVHAENNAAVSAPDGPLPNADRARVIHRVRAGETLASIARRYGVSVSVLRSFNGLEGDRIVAGRRLAIP